MVSKEFVLSQIEKHGSKFYRVFNDSKHLLDECYDGEYTVAELKERLSAALEHVNCIATVWLLNRNDQNKGGHSQKFEYRVDARQGNTIGRTDAPVSAPFNPGYLKEYLDSREDNSLLRVQLANKDNEILNLRAKIKELEEDDDSDGISGTELAIIKEIKELLTPAPKQVAAAIHGTENMTPEERSERIKTAISQWAKLDADFLAVLEKIVELRRSNPSKYNMAKSML